MFKFKVHFAPHVTLLTFFAFWTSRLNNEAPSKEILVKKPKNYSRNTKKYHNIHNKNYIIELNSNLATHARRKYVGKNSCEQKQSSRIT